MKFKNEEDKQFWMEQYRRARIGPATHEAAVVEADKAVASLQERRDGPVVAGE